MTDIHEAVAALESSPEFRQFNAENPHHYLVHVFTTAAGKPAPVEIGYYGKESDTITVFKTSPVARMPSDEVFKEHGVLQRLDLAAVHIGLQQALEKAEEQRAANYPRHPAMKHICVLQQHDVPTWNITIVTNTLQMINMKFDAINGALISRSIQSLMNLARE